MTPCFSFKYYTHARKSHELYPHHFQVHGQESAKGLSILKLAGTFLVYPQLPFANELATSLLTIQLSSPLFRAFFNVPKRLFLGFSMFGVLSISC